PVVGITVPEVEPGSPADRAGIVAGDHLVSVNGVRHDFFSIGTVGVLEDLRAHRGETIVLDVVHANGQRETLSIQLRSAAELADDADGCEGPLNGKGALGIRAPGCVGYDLFFSGEYLQRDLPSAIAVGASETTRWFGVIVDGLATLVRQAVT